MTLLVVLVVAGCGGGGSGSPSETGAGPATSTPETETGAPTTSAEPPCDPRDFLRVLRPAFDGQAPKLRIVRVRVERCRNGYAQVFAVPDMSVCDPGVGYCYDAEQVFLGWRGDSWRILTSGTGLSCGEDAETLPLMIRICRALGYPDLSVSPFQMPSGNIGCAFAEGVLRCDVLSGLAPEPEGLCDLDWVGVVLTAEGTAEPLCAGDTVYERAAPTLAYGSTWQRDGFTCQSTKGGLSCRNRAGHAFTLARAAWTAS